MSPEMMFDVTIGEVCGMGLHFCVDGFRLVYLAIALIMWGCAGVFSREYMAHYKNRARYYIFFWATFAATVGVFLSADLYTTFIFFEIMSFTSYVWVAFDEKPESLRAAETYLAVAVIGGLVMLMGLFLLYDLFGTLRMSELGKCAGNVLAGETFVCAMGNPVLQLYTAAGLMLFGFGAKAGCLPLHIWLPKAHPVAPAPASALLSGILTKAGVFGIILISCVMLSSSRGWGLLITVLGVATMFWGAFLAVFSINLKKTLACSSVSQIGFILTGIGTAGLLRAAGEEPVLSVHGAFLHMCNHSMFKLVLFLCAGVVYMNLHELDLNKIRGFGRGKKVLVFAFLMGALGIGGIPFWSGYVSKTLLHEGIVEYIELLAEHGADVTGWKAVEWIFLVTGGMTVAYMLKLFFALFVEKNEDPKRQAQFDAVRDTYIRPESAAALLLPAILIPVCGMTPSLTMDRIAESGQLFFGLEESGHAVHYFAFANLKGGLISIGIGIVLYIVVVRGCLMERGVYVDRWPSWLDLEDRIYRPVITKAVPAVCGFFCELIDRCCIAVPLTVFLSVAKVVCRCMDHLADGGILLARRTTHSQIPSAVPKLHSERRIRTEEVLHGLMENLRHSGMLVEESFSFGLMLTVLGLCLTLGFLLAVFIRG